MKKRLNILIGIGIVFTVILAIIAIDQFRKDTDEDYVFEFDHPAIANPEVAGKQIVKRVELQEPKPAFNFKLTDVDKSVTQLSDWKGKLVLVGFIYTSCPDVCGLLTQHFKYIQRQFGNQIEDDLVLTFITTDPLGDTPERLNAYTKGFQGRWHFLTGSEPELRKVWDQYKVFVKAKQSIDLVYHTYMVTLIDRDANIRYRYIGLVDPEEVIVKDIKNLLNEGEGMI